MEARDMKSGGGESYREEEEVGLGRSRAKETFNAGRRESGKMDLNSRGRRTQGNPEAGLDF